MKVFIDANAFVANTLTSDPLHDKAQTVTKHLRQQSVDFFTTSDVLKEALTIISQRGDKESALKFLKRTVDAKSGINIIFINQNLNEEGIIIFKKVKQKDISAVDCTSFAVMKMLEVKEVFTFDKHFEKMGFTIIKSK